MKKTVIVTASLFFLAGIAAPAPTLQAAPKVPAPKVGAPCKTANASEVTKSRNYFCLKDNGQNKWVIVRKQPSSKRSAQKLLKKWLQTLPTPWSQEMISASQPQQAHLDALTVAQQNRDANSAEVSQASAQIQQLQNEIAGLPDQISLAQVSQEQAKSVMRASLNELKSADAIVSSLSASYSSAMDNKYVITTEIVLCTFGFRACTPGQYDAALSRANATVARYESAEAVAAGARARYDGFYRDYKTKYDAYSALFDRKNTAHGELSQVVAHKGNLEAVIPSLEDTLSRAHLAISLRAEILNLVPSITQLENALKIQSVKLSKSGKRSAMKKFSAIQGNWLRLGLQRSEVNTKWTRLQSL